MTATAISSVTRISLGNERRVLITSSGEVYSSAVHGRNTKLYSLCVAFKNAGTKGEVYVTVEDAPFEVRTVGREYSRGHHAYGKGLDARQKTKLRETDLQPNGKWLLSLGNTGRRLEVNRNGDVVTVTADAGDTGLKQLLAEMESVTPRPRVLVFGTTNRAEDLDPALLRSGRFTRRFG